MATRSSTATARTLPALLPLLAAACTEDGSAGAPTFAGDVARIVYSSCTPCHRPGQPSPFPLLDYDDVFQRRRKIAEVTRERRMPPWLPTHGDFVGDRRLDEQSLELLQQWLAAGAPRGDAAAEPRCPEFADGWQLREPDLVLTLPQAITVAADGPDSVRNFVVPVATDADRFVAAVEIRPGSPAVHHAVLAIDLARRARKLDAADAEPGFAGMALGGARAPDGHFIGWTPGKRARPCPDGMAWRLPSGADLVLQLHLVPTGRPETVRPSIGFHFTATPPRVVSYPLCLFAPQIDLPAGDSDVAVGDRFVVPVPVTLHSVYPHAHYLCRKMAAWVTLPGGERRDLFQIDRWDFDWQDDYTFRTPMPLPAGTRIEFEYRYDNSASNPANPSQPPRRVQLGEASTDEMATLGLHVTTADLDARRMLGEACIRADLDKLGYDAALLIELAGLLRETGRTDEALRAIATVRAREPANADALFELGNGLAAAQRLEEAERAYADCVRADPGQNNARIQLANILLRSGRWAAAIPLYEAALQLDPDLAALHNNLATACMAAGLLDRAEQHYRRTVALDATIFQAWFNLGRVLAATGRGDEARAALLRAQQLRPDDPGVQQDLQRLGR